MTDNTLTQAVVIGCGVIGLSTAIRLQEQGLSVTIITRELPQHTTSAVAGAIWAGYSMAEQNKSRALTSLKTFQQLATDSATGVTITRYRELFRRDETLPWYNDHLPVCDRIPTDALPAGYTSGYITAVPLIQSPQYMRYLLNRFHSSGGTLQQREIETLSDVADYPLVINCTGVQARHVADDDTVHPIWGQVVRVHAPHITESCMDDEHFTYIFPRDDGVILGGVHIHDRWQRQPDDAITADILTRCQQLIPQLGDVQPDAVFVGLRPGRHEVRLEIEYLTPSCTVIHNYGHAGIGYTLSWGCADEVAMLIKNELT